MLRNKTWLGWGLVGAATAALFVGMLGLGCGGDSAGGGRMPQELHGKWVAKDPGSGEETVLNITGTSFESMPVNESDYLAKKAGKTDYPYDDDDLLWAQKCNSAMTQAFPDGYITVGVKGRASANNRTITIEITSIYGAFWNQIWDAVGRVVKCVLLHVLEKFYAQMTYITPSFMYSIVNSMFDDLMVPLSNKWYSKTELKNAIKASLKAEGEEEQDINWKLDMIDAMFGKNTLEYELDAAKEILKITGADGSFTVYEKIKVEIE